MLLRDMIYVSPLSTNASAADDMFYVKFLEMMPADHSHEVASLFGFHKEATQFKMLSAVNLCFTCLILFHAHHDFCHLLLLFAYVLR